MPNKVKLKRTLAKYDKIDIVDVLDSMIDYYAQAEIKYLSKEAKAVHLEIGRLLRKDIMKAIK